jgi:hypothetical protein
MKTKMDRFLIDADAANDLEGNDLHPDDALAAAEHCERMAAIYRIIAEGTPSPLSLTPQHPAHN